MTKRNIFAWLLVWLICFSPLFAAGGHTAPKLVVPEPIHDFKEVREGTVLTHTFRVRNEGDQLLEIKAVRPG